MKENDGLEAVLAALDKLQNDLCSTEPGHLVEAYEAFETIRNYITGGNGMTASRPVDAALKSPPECEIEPLGYLHEIKEPQGQEFKMYSASKESPWGHWQKQHLSECDYKCTPLYAALPHCPDGYELVKLGRFKPTPFSPVTYVTKTHLDRIRVDCVGEKNSYSFALPIAAAEGNK